ncbi:hypothetical protein GN956_G21977 [Arapaima gigas]
MKAKFNKYFVEIANNLLFSAFPGTKQKTSTPGTTNTSTLTHYMGQSTTPESSKTSLVVAKGAAAAGAVALLGVTVVCLCRRLKNKTFRRKNKKAAKDTNYYFIKDTLRNDDPSGPEGLYSIITDVPSTFLPDPLGPPGGADKCNNKSPDRGVTYSVITHIPSESVSPTQAEEQHIYTTFQDQPPHLAPQDLH